MPPNITHTLSINYLEQIVTPPLIALSNGALLRTLPFQTAPDFAETRRAVAFLEILAHPRRHGSVAGVEPRRRGVHRRNQFANPAPLPRHSRLDPKSRSRLTPIS